MFLHLYLLNMDGLKDSCIKGVNNNRSNYDSYTSKYMNCRHTVATISNYYIYKLL